MVTQNQAWDNTCIMAKKFRLHEVDCKMFKIEFHSNNKTARIISSDQVVEASHPLSHRMEDFPPRKCSSSTLAIVVAVFPHSCLSSSIHHSCWPQEALTILPPTILSDHHPCHLTISSSNPCPSETPASNYSIICVTTKRIKM